MALIRVRDLELSFGADKLFDGVEFQLESRERVCLIGRNGEGKTTFLKLIAGSVDGDGGEIVREKNLMVSSLTQVVPKLSGSVREIVGQGFGEQGRLINQYQNLLFALNEQPDDSQLLAQLEKTQRAIEDADAWEINQKIETTLSRFQLEGDSRFADLSGGLKRRTLLAQSCVVEPDILLLDEPTNHLDIDAIEWLEEFLIGFNGCVLFITHDRAFMQKLATRIVELDRGKMTSWPGDYQNYLRKKEERAEIEQSQNAKFDKKLAEEEKWIRQGIKARRTRNEGRVRALKKLREQRAVRRNKKGEVALSLHNEQQSGKLVIEVDDLHYGYDNKIIVQGLSTQVIRGDKIGIIGPNGVGKTTLVRLLLGELAPQQGSVKHGTRLQVAYFDQLRGQLKPEETVLDNICEGSDFIELDGKRKHAISYLQDFLFTAQQARTPVSALSGGEQNRVMLAKLFTRPANLLVLDEPTNDLDVETLELLEEQLLAYQGTLLLISHDRALLNNVVTSTLVIEPEGVINEYVGSYDDYLRQWASVGERRQPSIKQKNTADGENNALKSDNIPTNPPVLGKTKLSYKDQRELSSLPARIEQLEQAIAEIHQTLSDPETYKTNPRGSAELKEKLSQQEADLEQCYLRWEELED